MNAPRCLLLLLVGRLGLAQISDIFHISIPDPWSGLPPTTFYCTGKFLLWSSTGTRREVMKEGERGQK